MSRRASGFGAWVLQRITGIYLIFLFPYLLMYFLFTPPADIDEWRSWIAQPIISIALSLGLLSMLLHAWVGVRNIYIDYVRSLSLRVSLLTLTAFGLLACGMWGTQLIFLTRI